MRIDLVDDGAGHRSDDDGEGGCEDEYGGLLQPTKRFPEIPRILPLLSSVLEKSIKRYETSLVSWGWKIRKDVVTMFHGSKVPALTTQQYLERIYKYSNCTTSCFVVAYIYMDRFLSTTRTCLTSLNLHRLLITAVMLAVKFTDNGCYNNDHFARVGGISTVEMNKLEIEFLFCVDFRLHVTPYLFSKYCARLEEEEEEEATMGIYPVLGCSSWPKKDSGHSKSVPGYNCKPL